MSGVFLSYSRPNRDLALQVATALRAIGVEVWWDEDMPGVNWQAELERQIKTLTAVVVLWTPASVNSENVKDEARLAQQHKKLINLMSGVTEPPFPFDRANGLPLDGWTGVERHSGWTRLIKTVEDYLVQAGVGQAGALSAILAQREKLIRSRQQAIADAQKSHQAAQVEEGAAITAHRQAESALDDAQEQLRQVVAMRGSVALTKTAQAGVDEAMAARDQAAAARKQAGAAVAKAARGLTAAKGRFDDLFDTSEPMPAPTDDVDPPPNPEPPTPEPAPPPVPDLDSPNPAPSPQPGPAPKPIPPQPKPQGSSSFGNFVGAVVLLVIMAAGVNWMSHKLHPAKPVLDPNTAAAADKATTDLSLLVTQSNAQVERNLAAASLTPPTSSPGSQSVLATLTGYDAKTVEMDDKSQSTWKLEYDLVKPAAEAGNPQAQDRMGYLFEMGHGVSIDMAAARQWYIKAAKNGSSDAQTWLDSHKKAAPSLQDTLFGTN